MQCPFIYADGHQCTGEVKEARAYGKERNGGLEESDIKKIRLWCSEKWNHAGAVSSWESKNRMEFYPSELLEKGIYAAALEMC